jgi:hypothetical protein
VLLGTARHVKKDFPASQIVAKPYDYAPLIRKIEGLLDEARQRGTSVPGHPERHGLPR